MQLRKFLLFFVACTVFAFGGIDSAWAYNVTYTCGTSTGTIPTDATNYNSGDAVKVKPNTCTVPSGKHFAGYQCGGTYVAAGNGFTINGNTTCVAQYNDGKFAVTTTSTIDSVQFSLSAAGEFTVDCGDGGTLSGSGVSGNTITRSGTTAATYTCTWGSAGAHTIGFSGTATNYSTEERSIAVISFYAGSNTTAKQANAAKIASISGNLSTIFPYISGNAANGAQPRFYYTFYGATNLTSIPATLFADYTTASTYMFDSTFYYCSGLTTLPNGLFFSNAQSVVVGVEDVFLNTFISCTSLTSLPSGLFFSNAQSVSGADSMFAATFWGCTGLTTLPSDLFSKITSGAKNMFSNTFRDCTNLGCETAGCSTGTGYIPSTLFAGITPRGSNATNTMYNTFQSTKLVEACPTGTTQYTTGWEGSSTWNSKKSCIPTAPSHNITYVMDGGTNYSGAPETYGEGVGATIDGVPTKSGYVFAGWCTDSGLNTCAMSQTIGTDATTDQTFYAKWTQCTACAATNASCSLSVVSNVCTYTTSCNAGYGNIQNSGAYNASCSPVYNVTYACGDGATGTAPTDSTNYVSGASVTTVTTANNTCTKTGNTFAGWTCGGTDVNAGSTFTISDDTTCTARWTACTACDATNATCSLSVVSNVCTYTTSCNNGYGNIQNNGAYNASCSACTPCDATNASCSVSTVNNVCTYTTSCNAGYGNIQNAGAYNASCSEVDFYSVTYACGDGATGTAPTDNTDYESGVSVTTKPNSCSKTNSTFAGWTCGGTNVNAGSTFTISANTTCTARWNECTACAGNAGVNCSVSVSNNTCTYTTSCAEGYGNITGNGTANASCTPNTYDITYDLSGGESCSDVPSAYEQVEYLSISSVGPYIQTDYVGNLHSRYEGAVYMPSNNDCYYIASRMNSNNTRNVAFGNYNGLYIGWGTYTPVGSQRFSVSTDQRIDFVTDFHNMSKSITVNDSTQTKTIQSNEITTSFTNTAPLQIFFNRTQAANSSVSYAAPGGTRIYYLKTYDSGVLSHNFIPARRKSDNVLGFYDTVTNTFLTNAGTGTFGAGEVVNSVACGTNYNGAPTTYTYGTGATINGTPTREGYTFAGWCTDSGLTSCSDSQTINTTATGDKVFYAKWTESGDRYNVTYECGTGASGTAPTDSKNYLSGASVTTVTTANNSCSKTNSTFAGWTCGGTDVNAGSTFTISANITCTARWNACTTCAGNTGVTCSLSVSNNTCTYATSCDSGYYGLTNSGAYNASCSACGGNQYYCTNGTRYTVSSGYYSTGGTSTTRTGTAQCVSGEYCVNGVKNDCPSGYENSVVGATAQNQCYRACTTDDFEYAATVSGNYYYDGTNTCTIETCETGATVQGGSVTLADLVGSDISTNGTARSSITLNGSAYDGNNAVYGLTKTGTFGVTFSYGKIIGQAACDSKYASSNASGTPDGALGGYCWCKTLNFNDGTGWQDAESSVWVMSYNYGSSDTCKYYCPNYCGHAVQNVLAARTALYNSANVSGGVASCTPNTYDITYVMNGGTNYSGAPATYTYGTGATISGTPTKSGYTFAGWCTDSGLTSCANSQTIATDATGDKTFYAKWIDANSAIYNVTYSCGNGASGTTPTDSTDYLSGTTVTTANNTCTKTGNIFTGWSCGGNSVAAGGTFTINDDTICTAQWSACTACDATNASCELSVVNNTCTYATSCNTGYGNMQNNNAYNASCSANDITIIWQDNEGDTITTNSCTYGETISIPENPTVPGYRFVGWRVVN